MAATIVSRTPLPVGSVDKFGGVQGGLLSSLPQIYSPGQLQVHGQEPPPEEARSAVSKGSGGVSKPVLSPVEGGGIARESTAPVSGGELHDWIDVPAGVDAAERLGVYANGYPARVQAALEETFPALAHVVGASRFSDLVHRYVDATPLRSYNLNDAGAELAQFLIGDPLAIELPFLPDLARLEWHVARAFHAYDQPVLDPTALASWSAEQWEGAMLRFQPWVAVVFSDWPIRDIWACRDTPIEEIDIDLEQRPDSVLVRRCGYTVTCESLDREEALALDALCAGQTLGGVLAACAARAGDAAAVSAWFASWMGFGLIAGCDFATR
jgi:hypothetical protein